MKLFKRRVRTPATHDYSTRYWSHDYVIHRVENNGDKLQISGWGRGIMDNDFIILDDQCNGTTRYQFQSVEYYTDPHDMWSGTVIFAPRPEVPA